MEIAWKRVHFVICTSRRRFENFKTSRATINQEMHERVHAIFCLLYSQQSYFGIIFVFVLFNFLVDFPFCCPILPSFQKGLCCFQSILVFRFLEHRFGLNSKKIVSHFVFVFKFGAYGCFHSNFRTALHSVP